MKLAILFVFGISMIIISITWMALSARQISLYDADNYNCVDSSIDCRDFFESIGLDANMVYGLRGESGNQTGHCWVVLNLPFGSYEFESTTLLFSDVSSKYRINYIGD